MHERLLQRESWAKRHGWILQPAVFSHIFYCPVFLLNDFEVSFA